MMLCVATNGRYPFATGFNGVILSRSISINNNNNITLQQIQPIIDLLMYCTDVLLNFLK